MAATRVALLEEQSMIRTASHGRIAGNPSLSFDAGRDPIRWRHIMVLRVT